VSAEALCACAGVSLAACVTCVCHLLGRRSPAGVTPQPSSGTCSYSSQLASLDHKQCEEQAQPLHNASSWLSTHGYLPTDTSACVQIDTAFNNQPQSLSNTQHPFSVWSAHVQFSSVGFKCVRKFFVSNGILTRSVCLLSLGGACPLSILLRFRLLTEDTGHLFHACSCILVEGVVSLGVA
jgi:hypothetical protein